MISGNNTYNEVIMKVRKINDVCDNIGDRLGRYSDLDATCCFSTELAEDTYIIGNSTNCCHT